jgi:hypothetical protein
MGGGVIQNVDKWPLTKGLVPPCCTCMLMRLLLLDYKVL